MRARMNWLLGRTNTNLYHKANRRPRRLRGWGKHGVSKRVHNTAPIAPRPARQMAEVSNAAQQATLRSFAHVRAQPAA